MIFHFHRRCYIFGRRIHHGLTGAALAVLGILLMVDDWADRPWRLHDTTHGL